MFPKFSFALQRKHIKKDWFKTLLALASVVQLVGALSHKLKGLGFDSQSGHMPEFPVWSLGRHVCEAANWCFSCVSVSFYLPSSLSGINGYILGCGLKKNNKKLLYETFLIIPVRHYLWYFTCIPYISCNFLFNFRVEWDRNLYIFSLFHCIFFIAILPLYTASSPHPQTATVRFPNSFWMRIKKQKSSLLEFC